MKVSLALGGGGSRGISHLGVLKTLEENNIKIGSLAGTSIGGLIGATYLAGHSADELIDRFSQVNQPKLYGQRKGDEPSLLGLAGGTKLLEELLGDLTFDDLDIPFAVTAVDIVEERAVTINEGRLLDAVLATIAVPGIFPARRLGSKLLVDGGVANPVPVDIARKLHPTMPVIAVVLTERTTPSFILPVPEIPMAAPVVEYLSNMRLTQSLNIFLTAIDAGSKFLTEAKLQKDKPDVLIRPKLGEIGLLDTINIREVAEFGMTATEEVLEDIIKITSLGYQLKKLIAR